jgi:hypothetical protein
MEKEFLGSYLSINLYLIEFVPKEKKVIRHRILQTLIKGFVLCGPLLIKYYKYSREQRKIQGLNAQKKFGLRDESKRLIVKPNLKCIILERILEQYSFLCMMLRCSVSDQTYSFIIDAIYSFRLQRPG